MKKTIMFIILSLCVSVSVKAYAEQSPDDWKTTASLYMWAAALNGTSTSGEDQSPIDLSFSDIWDSLDVAAMGTFRVEKGLLGIQADIVSTKLSDDFYSGPVRVEIEPTLIIIELDATHRIGENFQLIAGMRYYDVDIKLNIKGDRIGSKRGSDEQEWIDGVLGMSYSVPLTDQFSFKARGDIGAGGSTMSWQLLGLGEYRINETFTISGGWRHLDWDYDTGKGDEKFGLKAYMDGPIFGARFSF